MSAIGKPYRRAKAAPKATPEPCRKVAFDPGTARRNILGMLLRGPILVASIFAVGCGLDPAMDELFGPTNTFSAHPPGPASSSSSSSSSSGGGGGAGGAGSGGQGGATTASSSSSTGGVGGQGGEGGGVVSSGGGEGGGGPVCLTCWQAWQAVTWKTGSAVDNFGMCSDASSTKLWNLKKCACSMAVNKGCGDLCLPSNEHPTQAQIDQCTLAVSVFCDETEWACQQAP